MKYYAIGQNKQVTGKYTGMNSLDFGFLSDADTEKLVPVKIFCQDRDISNDLTLNSPKYGDIINGVISVYSDRFCDIVRELNLPIIIKPAQLTMAENPNEISVGYNLILQIPDVKCTQEEDDIEDGEYFELDETLAKGQSFFHFTYEGYNNILVIDEALKRRFDEIELGGIYITPVTDINNRIAFDLKS
jgi:hypothetical protein